MKHIVFFVTLSMAGVAWGQAQKPAAPVETAKPAPEAAKPVAEAAKPAAPAAKPAPKAAGVKNSRRQQDARHCLERSTNNEVIKCAEGYL
jgi:hypothetical protein